MKKATKYLMMGVLMIGFSTPTMAQDDNKATIDAISNVIKSKPADLADQVKAVYKKNKKNEDVLIGIANAYYDTKDTLNARVFANYALKANREYAPAYIMLGDIESLNNDGGKAAEYYNQAIYFDPKNPEGYYKYASVYRKISPDEAVAKLEDLRAQRPDIAVDAMVGHIFYVSNEFSKAISNYAKVGRDKLEEKYVTEYAMALYFTQKYKESLAIAQHGLTRTPRDAAYNRLAFFNCTDLADYPKALEYADALFNKSDSAKFSYYDYIYYGNALSGNKEYDKAIEMYNKALTMEIDNKDKRAGVIKQLSDGYKKKGDFDNAIKYQQEYMNTISKQSANDIAALAQLYIQYADTLSGEKRIETFKKAEGVYSDLESKYPDALEYATFMKARVNSYMDPETKDGLAKPYYEKLASLIEPKAEKDTSDKARLVECYRYLGYFNLLKEDKATADSYWKKIIEIDPNNETAKQALGIK